MISPTRSLKRGYVQVYTGAGKGKTTTAFGLAVRAAGAGLRVFIAQFLKGGKSSEVAAIERLSDLITVRQYGRGGFLRGAPDEEDIHAARQGLTEAREALRSGRFAVVVLDEANIAAYLELLSVEDLLELIRSKPEGVELVITGRYADRRVVDEADLVTEMREIKHYYTQGVKEREGIEK